MVEVHLPSGRPGEQNTCRLRLAHRLRLALCPSSGQSASRETVPLVPKRQVSLVGQRSSGGSSSIGHLCPEGGREEGGIGRRMVLELYLDLLSQPCRAVFIFAKKNNVPFIVKSMEMLKGQLFSEEFNKVNILRKVPVLKDGDFVLEESTAILLYLTRKYNTPSHWYPPDIKKRARVDEFLAWQHTNLRPCAAKILWLRVVIPLFLGQQIPSEKVQDALEELNVALQKLDEKFLQDRPFLIGAEVSLADLVAITELMQPMGAGWDVFEGRPKLQEWRKRVEMSVGRELFLEAHARILNAQELRSIAIDPPLKAQMKPLLLKMLK